MKSQIERIRYSLKEVKGMFTVLENEIDEMLYMTSNKNKAGAVNNTKVIETFGSFKYKELGGGRILVTDNWRNDNIIRLEINGVTIWCNKHVAPQFAGAFAEIIAAGLWAEIDLAGGGGCYVARHKNWKTESTLSKHSWGIALDINPGKYPYGSIERIDPRVVKIFIKWGFFYGGDWRKPDPMHIEWRQFII